MIKIAMIFMRFPAASEAFASSDVRVLSSLDCEVHVYNLRPSVANNQQLIIERGLENIKISKSNSFSILKGILQFFHRPQVAIPLLLWCIKNSRFNINHFLKTLFLLPRTLDVFTQIEKTRPDVVHLFWGHYPAMVGFLVKRFCQRIRLSMFLGAYDLLTAFNGSWQVASKADVVWTHARCNLDRLENAGIPGSKIVVWHRGIDLSLVPSCRDNHRPLRIVTAGRLVSGKGFAFLIEAFSAIHRQCPEVELVLLGDGPERANLEKQVRGFGLERAVTFKGHVKHAQVFAEFSTSRVFLFCSQNPSERLPNVVKEAMACGCVCVVTPTPGIEELVRDTVTGFVVPKDLQQIVLVVCRLLEDAALQQTIAANARQFIADAFNAETQIRGQLRRWQALVEHGSLQSRGE